MCGAQPKISAATIEQNHSILDGKIKNLNNSGYFKEPMTASANLPRTLDGLISKIKMMSPLYEKLEQNSKRDFGCLPGQASTTGRDYGKFKICFQSNIRFINPDGTVETTMMMSAYAYQQDGTVANYNTFSERVSIYLMPTICPNGAPQFSSTIDGTSNGQKFTANINATCEKFDSSYSAIYPNLTITY